MAASDTWEGHGSRQRQARQEHKVDKGVEATVDRTEPEKKQATGTHSSHPLLCQ